MLYGFRTKRRIAPVDFVVKVNDENDPDLGEKIIASLFIRRAKLKKPTVMFIGGSSGSGKSLTAVRLQEVVCKAQGIDHKQFMDLMNVYTPIQYPKKIDRILYDKEAKDVMLITLHEAREIIKAKDWHSFLAMTVADINAMSRSIKRLGTIIVSQFIRDITMDMRYTLDYYGEMEREGRTVRLHLKAIWKDTGDLHNPKIRTRGLRGILIYPDGTQRTMYPSYLNISLPDKETERLFDEQDTEAKGIIIRAKVEKLLKHMEKEFVTADKKISVILDYYMDNPNLVNTIAKQGKKGWKLLPHFKKMHDLTNSEEEVFHKMFNDRMKNHKMFNAEEVVQNAESDTRAEV